MSTTGILFVLSSPSGGGKSTLGRLCLDRMDNLVYSVSYTTREPRGDEQDGVAYHFIERARFLNLVEEGFFLEWEEVHENLYGTGRKDVSVLLDAGKDVLLDLDVQGGLHVQRLMPEQVVLVFVLPPSPEILHQRLRTRATDPEEHLRLRIRNAEKEIREGISYDYLIINDQVQAAVEGLCCLVYAERSRMVRRHGFLRQAGYLDLN